MKPTWAAIGRTRFESHSARGGRRQEPFLKSRELTLSGDGDAGWLRNCDEFNTIAGTQMTSAERL
jgi:hypothetical protein